MQAFCEQVFHQLELIVTSTSELISSIEESDWEMRPTAGRFSIGELAGHIALICEADTRIANGASEAEMKAFYSSRTPISKKQALIELAHSFEELKNNYLPLTESELRKIHIAYWGVSYSRFEWLLETLVHLTHHRGQLHAMLVHHAGKDPKIALFE
ncbi:damage-inducible protein DinB [Planococcus plakortidis]|uniref:Damage-inducible protein DinB n=1 Tax=Planococcus plakortidis TaxID=1038856 RepID=A0A1C7E961_9BACL|nr:DinB family protein [Planococcus plakortidis]ANU20504.1 damage-inducible protein DinB [Planococcus plakortidis]